jgi:hypothetical protein
MWAGRVVGWVGLCGLRQRLTPVLAKGDEMEIAGLLIVCESPRSLWSFRGLLAVGDTNARFHDQWFDIAQDLLTADHHLAVEMSGELAA